MQVWSLILWFCWFQKRNISNTNCIDNVWKKDTVTKTLTSFLAEAAVMSNSLYVKQLLACIFNSYICFLLFNDFFTLLLHLCCVFKSVSSCFALDCCWVLIFNIWQVFTSFNNRIIALLMICILVFQSLLSSLIFLDFKPVHSVIHIVDL